MHAPSHTAYKGELKAFLLNFELVQTNILENSDSHCLRFDEQSETQNWLSAQSLCIL